MRRKAGAGDRQPGKIGEEGAPRPPASPTTVRPVPYTAVPVVPRFGDVVACHPMSAQPYLTDSVRYFRLQGPLARHLLRAGRNPVSRFPTGSALCRAVIPAPTASADFCPPIPASLGVGSQSRQTDRPPRVLRTHLPPIHPSHLLPPLPDDYRASDLFAFSPRRGWLVCASCPSGRGLCCRV